MKYNHRSKRGFGLLEVLLSAVVLGFLVLGLTQLQMGNREALLRIRSRDAAQIIAQDFLDSLSSLGISSIRAGQIEQDGPITKGYEWTGKNDMTAKITYTITGTITPAHKSVESSNLDKNPSPHIASQNIDLTVSWPFKNSMQSIKMQRIIK